MAAQSAPDKPYRLNWPQRWFATPVKPSDDASAKASSVSPPTPPAESPAECPDGFPPLTVSRTGDTVRIDRPLDEKVEWTNADFGCLFLHWLASEYPPSRNGWVSVFDIEDEFFPRFQEAAGCHDLGCGALYRGLGEVTRKRERRYTDGAGKRSSMTEYLVPDTASVVDIAERREAS